VGWSDVGHRVTHFTGYCCWFEVGPRERHFTGYCCWSIGGHGQHTLLGIVGLCASGNTLRGTAVGLCGASGNTLYWVLLVYVVPWATHFTGYCCWLCCASGNTPYSLLLLVYEGPRTTHFTGYCWG
jgi:hypothetical protein